MSQASQLNIYFVLPKEDPNAECSKDMYEAFRCVKNYKGKPKWMLPSECLAHVTTSNDVFVLDEFVGDAFDKLKKAGSKVLGAKCMLTCMSSGDTIPPGDSPIFTEGMRGLIVCCTGFDVETKKRLQEKVEFMGGVYHPTLRSVITHIVAYNNISVKAIEAYNVKIPIMREEWVQAVWNRSLVANVRGSDVEFLKYQSPLFHNLKITTSGISKRRKDELKDLITQHGGLFTGQLEMNLTNILIVEQPGGDKYDAAVGWKIPCVKSSWLRTCVELNKIVPFRDYSVDKKQKASTPKKGDAVNFTGNFSAISVIEPEERPLTHLDESANVTSSQVFSVPLSKPDPLTEKVDKIAQDAAHAGQFLDGCNVYLSGFSQSLAEKLRKVLNVGGATRFDDLNSAVTHIVVPRLCGESLKETTAYILPIEWLLASVALRKPAPVEGYLLNNITASNSAPPSPLSKQSARLLSRPDPKNLQQEFEIEELPDPPHDENLAYLYQQSQHGEPISQRTARSQLTANRSSASSSKSDLTQTNTELFNGLLFFLSSKLEPEEQTHCRELVLKHNGKIVSKKFAGIPHYAVVPIDGDRLTDLTPLEVVNLFFIQECIQQNQIVTLQYFHHPFSYAGSTPLNGCVICISQYVGCEKDFIELVIEKLGAVGQSVMAKKEKRGILKTTHLVCVEPSGAKYDGAIRWGVPVVHHDWLFKCAELGSRVSEEAFLLPGSKMPITQPEANKGIPTSTSKSSEISCNIQTPMTDNVLRVSQSIASKLRELNARKTYGALEEKEPESQVPAELTVETTKPVSRKLFEASVKNSPIVEKPSLSVVVQPSTKPQSLTPEVVKLPLNLSRPMTPAMQRVCESLKNTPQLSQSPEMNRTQTPEQPLGACFGLDNPSPTTRKRLGKWIDQGANFPVETPPKRFASQQRRDSTPLSSLLSKHLISMMRRPEDQPPDDSPDVSPGRQIIENDVINGLQKMKEIEESYARTSSVPSPVTVAEEPKVMIVTESQPHTEVGWDDPSDRDLALASLEKDVVEPVRHVEKMFMFSGLSDPGDAAKSLITNCKGTLSRLSYFDKSATHLIAGESMTRGEKLLGSIAAGLWVLHPSYLKQLAVVKDVHAMKEEDFEWGNPNVSMPLDALTPNVRDCVVNAYYWRCEIQKSITKRPFWDMRFILLISASKRDVFARLLDAGGGEVTTADRVDSSKKNFCICEISAPPLKTDMEVYARKRICCVTTLYISDMILRKATAVQDNMVVGFAELWDRYN